MSFSYRSLDKFSQPLGNKTSVPKTPGLICIYQSFWTAVLVPRTSTDGPEVPTSAVNVTLNLSADLPEKGGSTYLGGQNHLHLPRTAATGSRDCEGGLGLSEITAVADSRLTLCIPKFAQVRSPDGKPVPQNSLSLSLLNTLHLRVHWLTRISGLCWITMLVASRRVGPKPPSNDSSGKLPPGR